MKSLDHYWYSQNPVAWLLWPVSKFYCLVVYIRRQFYLRGIFKSVAFKTPVVIVGNISVGGSGKTPLLIALCDYLKKQGKNPGIVSRGYGGRITGVRQVSGTDSAAEVGDEPFMIFQRTQCPVVVGRDRVVAVECLLSNNNCDIVLSDDGLQHYRLQRYFEICVVDAQRLHGNNFCLPAGPLREKISRLNSVDLTVYNGQPDKRQESEKCFYSLQFEYAVNLLTDEKRVLQSFSGMNIIAVAGIGYPDRFFRLLADQGLNVQPQSFSDHYQFLASDLAKWSGKCVLMTEKDMVKCLPLLQQSNPDVDLTDLWYLPVAAVFSDELERSFKRCLL